MIPILSPQLDLWSPIAGYDPPPHFPANALDRLLITLVWMTEPVATTSAIESVSLCFPPLRSKRRLSRNDNQSP